MRYLASILILAGTVAGLAFGLSPSPAAAQPPGVDSPLGGFGAAANDNGPKMTVEAGFTQPAADGTAQFFVKATLVAGWHTYSITQGTGAVIPTEVKVKPPEGVTLGAFQAVTPPRRERNETAYPGVVLETHGGTVRWVAPIRFAPGVDPKTLKLGGSVYSLICSDDNNGCLSPDDYNFTAALRADVKPATVAPVKPATPEPPKAEPEPAKSPEKPGAVEGKIPLAVDSNPSATPKPPAKSAGGEIHWYKFTTIKAFQKLVPGLDLEAVRNYAQSRVKLSLFGAILFGFLGGLVLNIMPCVLPVIGLKILSFVEQSGHSRQKAFMLNVWYSLGLLAVFAILASLAVGPQKLGWGQLFGETWFTIALTAVVFTMALSFMGVWEVSLPSFLGRGGVNDLAAHEGAVGAFFKGAMTTLLATPCSAPFLAPALVWATSQPPWLTYAVFVSTGLGMASPYLLIGAFPELLRFLPKPGAWMETFKTIMGFVLMGTVVYMLTILEPQFVVPTVGLLFALWFACWLVGRLSPIDALGAKFRAWTGGAAFTCAVWVFMFPGIDFRGVNISSLAKIMESRFSTGGEAAAAEEALPVGPKNVLVDFTADWCATCKTKESLYLHTEQLREAVERHGVVAVKADWSHKDKAVDVTKMLDAVGSRQIPVIAIFSIGRPNEPTILYADYGLDDVLKALENVAAPQ